MAFYLDLIIYITNLAITLAFSLSPDSLIAEFNDKIHKITQQGIVELSNIKISSVEYILDPIL